MEKATEIQIVDYDTNDYSELSAHWTELGLGGLHRGDNAEIIDRCNALGGFLILMKTETGKIIGSSWVTVDGRRSYLHHFGIAKEYQTKGFAAKLMDESMRRIKEIGMQSKLEVHRNNFKAISLYKKFEFGYLGDYDVYINRNI